MLPEGVHFEGEPVIVSVEVTNPLDVVVHIEKMHLYGGFRSDHFESKH